MAALMNKCALAAALPARVDGLLRNRDIDLTEGLTQAQVLFVDPIIRRAMIDQAGGARRVNLTNWPYANEHFRLQDQPCELFLQLGALVHDRRDGILDRLAVPVVDSPFKFHRIT